MPPQAIRPLALIATFGGAVFVVAELLRPHLKANFLDLPF